MRLLVGPPGSGKSTAILREARGYIESGSSAFRLVVPSSTMAEHLRNKLAREGLVVRPSTVVTLSGLVTSLTPEMVEIGGEELALLVSECLAAEQTKLFPDLPETPGLARTIASSIEDLSNSGCGPLQWAALGGMNVWQGKVLADFGKVWDRVEATLAQRGLCLRSSRIASAAAAARRGALGDSVRSILVDGFFTFSRLEIELLRALDRQSPVSVTLPDWPGAAAVREVLEDQGCQSVRFALCRAEPVRRLVAAVDPQRETEDVTVGVLEAAARGRSWRDMGVIVRSAGPYVPLLERAFARVGIPARFYFGRPLAGTAVFRFFDDWVEALLSGWEHRQTLAALRSTVHEAGMSPAAAALERVVVDRLPGAGLEPLAGLIARVAEAGAELLAKLVAIWTPMSAWAGELARPADWASRLASLGLQVAAPKPVEGASGPCLDEARRNSSALRTLSTTMLGAARAMPGEPILLEAFWRSASPILAGAKVHARDTRRDVVHVMDVLEARQWELPVVFVCGMVEGEFPRRIRPDPLLGDDLRFRLQGKGFPVLTSADREREEAFLCEFAQTRATAELTLSYPEFQLDGKPALRAFNLDTLGMTPVRGRPLRVAAASPTTPSAAYALQDEEVLNGIRKANATFWPTALEDFLQCPFRFFARRTLRLRDRPKGPSQRLTPAVTGTVMHDSIAAWHKGGGNLLAIVEREWRRALAENRIPDSWRTDTQWLLLERSARFYAVKGAAEPGWSIETEVPLSLNLGEFRFEGRADRVDRDNAGQARVLEFKFVGASGLRKRKEKLAGGLAVQAPLYALALETAGERIESYSIVGLRGDTEIFAYDEPEEIRQGIELAKERAVSAAFGITQGEIRVMPADEDLCDSCPYQDACRKRERQAEAAQETA
jgi:ATP-dependent helicase/DNAse subunit B